MSGGSTALLDPEVERPDLSGDGFVVSRSSEAERLTAFILLSSTLGS